jgi:hypothetical protein
MMRHVFAAALMVAQPFPGGGSNSGTAPVSPSVMATELGSVDQAGRGTLQLLILWRGTPGWFLRGGGGSSSGGGGSMAPGSGMIFSHWISQGGVNLTVRFDPAVRKVWIQDREVGLDDANVVLVDGVDSPAGPQVVRTLRIDPEYQTTPRGPVPAQTFIRRSPELVEFLQCDVTVPGLSTYEQQMFDLLCTRVKQP